MVNSEGQRIATYHLIKLLGKGTFGEVYLSKDIRDSTFVAVKLLKLEITLQTLKDFIKETSTLSQLRHSNIVPLLNFDIEDETPFIVMEYAPNGTLRQRHPAGSRVALETIIPYVEDIAAALQYVHDKKKIHSDIKPSNMLIGKNNEILLSDFGIASTAHNEHSLKTQETMNGTTPYMAPEQFQKKPMPASDQYALGIVVYEWLCGVRPFQGFEWEIQDQHLHKAPPPLREKNPAIPSAVEQVVLKALAKNYKERYPDIQTFAQALKDASKQIEAKSKVTNTQVPLLPPPTPPPTPPIPDLRDVTKKPTTPLPLPIAPKPPSPDVIPPRRVPPGGVRGNRRSSTGRIFIGLIIVALLLLIGTIAVMAAAQPKSGPGQFVRAILPAQQSPATITITPNSPMVEDTYTLTSATTTNASTREVAVRTVPGAAQSPSILVKATGLGHLDAIRATGQITFYNALGIAQQVNGGTIFTLTGGVRIITNTDVSVPPLVGTTLGSMPVSAHADPPGTAGNIPALTISNLACCGTNSGITANNLSGFTGGLDAVNYTFLKQSDVNNAISQSTMDVTKQDALNDLTRQFHPGEQGLGSPRCTPTFQADQKIDDQGVNVTSANVTYVMKCTTTVYDNLGAQNIIKGLLTQKAATTPGAGYTLVNNAIQITLTNQTTVKNVLSLFFTGKGVWAYQFSDAQKQQLAKAIAGKTVAEANTILKNTPGISNVTVNVNGGNVLPTDPNTITIVIQPIAGLGDGVPPPSSGSPIVTSLTVLNGTPATSGK